MTTIQKINFVFISNFIEEMNGPWNMTVLIFGKYLCCLTRYLLEFFLKRLCVKFSTKYLCKKIFLQLVVKSKLLYPAKPKNDSLPEYSFLYERFYTTFLIKSEDSMYAIFQSMKSSIRFVQTIGFCNTLWIYRKMKFCLCFTKSKFT